MFSVITVCRNMLAQLQLTVQSVVSQNCDLFEYIVIDGLSNDGTADFLKTNSSLFSHYIIEQDSGIYDAMNKGIKIATGQYIIFMNAGDLFHDSQVLQKVANIIRKEKYNLLIGETIMKCNAERRHVSPKNLTKNIWKGMGACGICHQSVFVKTEFAKTNLFNIANITSSDFEQIYLAFKTGSYLLLPIIVSDYEEGGLSSKRLLNTRLSDWKFATRMDSRIRVKVYHAYRYILSLLVLLRKEIYARISK